MPKTRKERQREAQIKAGGEADMRRAKRHDSALDLVQKSSDNKALRLINEQLLTCARDVDEILSKRGGGATAQGIAEISLHLADRRLKEVLSTRDALLNKSPHLANIVTELSKGKSATPETEKDFWAKTCALWMKFEETNWKLVAGRVDQTEATRQMRPTIRQLRRLVATNGMAPASEIEQVGILGDKLSKMMAVMEGGKHMEGVAARLVEAAMVGKDKISDETVFKLRDLCIKLGPLYSRLDDTSLLLNSGQVHQYAAEKSYTRTRVEILDLIKEAEKVTGQDLASLRDTLPNRVGEMALDYDEPEEYSSDTEAYADAAVEGLRLMEDFSLQAWSLCNKMEKIKKQVYNGEITEAESNALSKDVMEELNTLIDQTEIESGKDLSDVRKSLMQPGAFTPDSPTLRMARTEYELVKAEMNRLQSRMENTLQEHIDSFNDPKALAQAAQKIEEEKKEHDKLSEKLKALKSSMLPEPLQPLKPAEKLPYGPVEDGDSAVELLAQPNQERINEGSGDDAPAMLSDTELDAEPAAPSDKEYNIVEAVKSIASRQVFHDLRDMRLRTDRQEKVIKYLLKKNRALETKQTAYDNIATIHTSANASDPDSDAEDPFPERMEAALRNVVRGVTGKLAEDMGNLVKNSCTMVLEGCGAMVEKNEEQIKEVVESIGQLSKAQQSVNQQMQQFSQVAANLKKDIEEIKGRLGKLESRVGSLEVGGVE